jgi:glutaredoxin
MRKLVVVALIIVGVWYWQKGGFTKDLSFDKNGKPVVVVFTTNGCAPCQAAINMLRARGVPFQEKILDLENEQDKDVKLWKKIGNNMLPLTLSGNRQVAGSSKWELISLLGENFGNQYLTFDELTYFMHHFDTKGSPKIVLYGAAWCQFCAALRKEFNDRGEKYVYVDVEKSGEFEKLTRVMEIPGYPAVWVGYTRVHGTTYDAVKAVVNKKT